MKHFYENLFGWFDFEDIYSEALKNASDHSTFVEVGAFMGKSTAYMGVEIINSGKIINFNVVDIFLGNFKGTVPDLRVEKYKTYPEETLLDIFKRNLQPLSQYNLPSKIWHMDSLEAAKNFKDESIDFLFLDADHSFIGLDADIKTWLPKVKKGGYITGHDYCKEWPEVERAVRENFGTDYEVINISWRKQK